MRAYINHFFLNIGAAISCVWYAVIPPQWTGHKTEDINNLTKGNPIKSFLEGIGCWNAD